LTAVFVVDDDDDCEMECAVDFVCEENKSES
jgi:hypothetical protein